MMMGTGARRFLMTLWEGGGTIPPQLGVARRLIAAGHRVHVLADPTIAKAAEAAGASFSAWQRAPHCRVLEPSEDLIKDWETSNPLAMLRRVLDRLMAGPAGEYAADTTDAIEAFRPDAVLSDFLLFGSIMAAQAAALPVAALVPNIWVLPTKGTPPIGPGFQPAKTALGRARDMAMLTIVNRLFQAGLPEINNARAFYGLEPLSSFYDQALSSERLLVLASPTFDYASETVPANARYLGPILDDPAWTEAWTPPWPADNTDPLVLVGFSATFQNQGPLLRRVIQALSSLPVRAVVTLGQMLDPTELTSTDNVAIVSSAPHSVILREASAIVSHCGHGTTMKALAAGVPIVCIPMGRDQNDTAARVVYHQAGIRLSPKASAQKIRNTIQAVLSDDCFRTQASRLASAIAREQRSADIVGEIEQLTISPPTTETDTTRPREQAPAST